MDARIVEKRSLGRLGRIRRLVTNIVNPRSWAHAFRLLNYFNYTNSGELRKARLGKGLHIAPNASFSNGHNLILGDSVRIGSNATIWAGHGVARIEIGADTMIGPNVSMSAANYRFNDGAPIHAQSMDEADIIIGRDVWVGFGATISAGSRIGDGAVIGAGSIIRGEVPARAVVAPEPSRKVGTRTLRKEAARSTLSVANKAVLDLLTRETARHGPEALTAPVECCGVDSFDLITMRTSIESATGIAIPDESWAGVERLEEIAALPCFSGVRAGAEQIVEPAEAQAPQAHESREQGPGRSTRRYAIEMPMMGQSGLSESWLFKELGDIHWAMITHFLRCPSSEIRDELGDRLYATFTRMRLEVEPHLRGFGENAELSIGSDLRRFGGSMYFADHAIRSCGAAATACTMSTFAKHGERGGNTSLRKGAPILPDPNGLESLSELPEFAAEYRRLRSEPDTGELFVGEYEVLPSHDINGVGLIYFAAYPSIFDLCVERAEGKGFLLSHSTVSKDICYLANAEPDETLVFRLHRRAVDEDGTVTHVASICRSSDGVRMGRIESVKRPI